MVGMHCAGCHGRSFSFSRNKDFQLNQHDPPKFPLRQLDARATPHMTAGHALLAIGFTMYALIAMRYEERDLARRYGSSYDRWRSSLATRHQHGTAQGGRGLASATLQIQGD
jgi:hypothetical protein